MRAAIRIGEFRGFRYAELDPELSAYVPTWLAEQNVRDGSVLKPGRVFRWRDCVVKFGGPERRWRDMLRSSRAIRSADLYEVLLPLPTPRPYLALERRTRGHVEQSVLVSAFVDGRSLPQLWHTDAEAVAAFPRFLADKHNRWIFHGDLHVENALWDGRAWNLLDLESLRHWMHGLFPWKCIEGTWARIGFRLEQEGIAAEPDLRDLFYAYWSHAKLRGDREVGWRRIQARVRARFDAGESLVPPRRAPARV